MTTTFTPGQRITDRIDRTAGVVVSIEPGNESLIWVRWDGSSSPSGVGGSSIAAAPAYEKEIRYCRKSKEYGYFLDGRLVGYARSYHAAEMALDDHVFSLLSTGLLAA